MNVLQKVEGYLKVERYFTVDGEETMFIELYNPKENWESSNSIAIIEKGLKDYYNQKPLGKNYVVDYFKFKVNYEDRENISIIILIDGFSKETVDKFYYNLVQERLNLMKEQTIQMCSQSYKDYKIS